MAKGKLRSPEEINGMIRDIRKSHRPLLREIEKLEIRERTLDWVMGGEDAFALAVETTAETQETEAEPTE